MGPIRALRLESCFTLDSDPGYMATSRMLVEAGMVLLNNPKRLLDMLINYDKDNMEEETVNKVELYYNNPDFTPKQIEKASKACTAICM